MEITLDGKPMHIELSTFLLLLLPGILYLLYLFFYFSKLHVKVQQYIENRYHVKVLFRWMYIEIQGPYSGVQKFGIELHLIFLLFLITFGPMALLGGLYFFLSKALVG